MLKWLLFEFVTILYCGILRSKVLCFCVEYARVISVLWVWLPSCLRVPLFVFPTTRSAQIDSLFNWLECHFLSGKFCALPRVTVPCLCRDLLDTSSVFYLRQKDAKFLHDCGTGNCPIIWYREPSSSDFPEILLFETSAGFDYGYR